MYTGLEEMKEEFGAAICADLGKKREANLFELCIVMASIKHDLKHIDKYCTKVTTETELLLAPGQTFIHYEPLGVVAVYSAWNYPVSLALKPVC